MVDKDTEAAIIIQKLEEQIYQLEDDKKGRAALVRKAISEAEDALLCLQRRLKAVREAV